MNIYNVIFQDGTILMTIRAKDSNHARQILSKQISIKERRVGDNPSKENK